VSPLRELRAIAALTAVAAVLAASPVLAQRVETGISRDTIRVGDPFRAVVRIELAPGTDLVLPDSLVSTEDVESAGTVRMRRDSANGVVSIAAAYPLTAWRPGPLPLPELNVTLKTPQGDRVQTIKLPDITVVSVLPADTTNIQAKPPKDVLGGNRVWWPWILALILALALALALFWWWRRRRKARPEDVPLPMIMPRERALEELERIRKLGLVRAGDFKRHYTLVSEVLRKYMSTTEPKWSTDLTTDELAQRTLEVSEAKPAISVLRQSDMVKFARSVPDAQTAERDLERTSDWITEYPAPAPVSVPAEGQAA
jgi:hypothetical protein